MGMARMLTFCIDPESGVSNMLSFDGLAADNNEDEKGITCAYFPRTKGPNLNVLQEQLLIGGMNLSAMWRTLIRGQAQDAGSDFTATAITNNLAPTLAKRGVADTSRFVKAEFPRTNPLEKTDVTVDFVTDELLPEEGSPTYSSLDVVSGSHIAGFPSAVARSINMRIRDTGSANGDTAVFDGVIIHYYELMTRHEGE